jgi:Gluconate 2-dehydrogenase subunit 3
MSRREPAPYASHDVLAKWETPSFDDPTREALLQRLQDIPTRRFFTAAEFALLESLVEELAPPLPGLAATFVALWIDDRVNRNLGEGFRNEREPPLQAHWRRGLAAVDAEAQHRSDGPFARSTADAKRRLLDRMREGDVDTEIWRGLDPQTFFTDLLLKTITGLCYAHPLAWNDIGFGGPASPRGYVRLGFDARDPWEAKEIR